MGGLTISVDNMDVPELERHLKITLKRTAKSTIQIGYFLKQLKAKGNYENWGNYVQDTFGLSISTAYRFMQLNDKYSNERNGMELNHKYGEYSTGVLVEMLNMPPELEAKVTPGMTVKQVREVKKEEPVETIPPEAVEIIQDGEFREIEQKEVVATSQKVDENSSCPPGIGDCIRQEWGSSKEEQKIGHQECAKCWAKWKKTQEILSRAEESKKEVEEEPLSAMGLPKTIYPEDSSLSTVGCGHKYHCFAMARESENIEPDPAEQPEFPKLKNMDEREEFVLGYQEWPVWCKNELTEETFYRFDLPDGSAIVVRHYPYFVEWNKADNGGKELYILKPGYKHFKNCESNMTSAKEHLKEVQRGR